MIPPIPWETVPPDISAKSLLELGKPFLDFPRYSVLKLRDETDAAAKDEGSVTEWLLRTLQIGQPVVIEDLDKLPGWDSREFDLERLIELLPKKNVPVRNCHTGRDLSFTLRKFVDSARQSHQEFQNLYARDLPCPREWQQLCRKLLPDEVQWGGRLDLFQYLLPSIRSEPVMAHVGSEGAFSGFHRCPASTIACNLLVQATSGSAICIGTDLNSQTKYDAFMSARGVSPQLDWCNLGVDTLRTADFPLYVCEQKVGDLVIFPPATAHQVWNPSVLTTKLAWNVLHPLCLDIGFQFLLPPLNRLCQPDMARSTLVLASAMLPLAQGGVTAPLPPDLPLLSRLFRQMVDDESIEGTPATPILSITVPASTITTCNFCGTAIWNRHVRCQECNDFDLCLSCYLGGRSCEHVANYGWAEIHSSDRCQRSLQKAEEIVGFLPEPSTDARPRKTIGSAVNDLMKVKFTAGTRLCHLCRIDHAEWKGRRCDKCTAFFCFRGLYRHFDMASADVLRHRGFWTCPKCMEVCNCRCCHFQSAYIKAEKPAGKRRVKPMDTRGKVMGFTDNVFDQKRGQRTSLNTDFGSGSQVAGQKRPLAAFESVVPTSYRKVEIQTPDQEAGGLSSPRESSADYVLESQFSSPVQSQASSREGPARKLPSIRTMSEQRRSPHVSREHTPSFSGVEIMNTLTSAASLKGKAPFSFLTPNTPTHPALLSPYVTERSAGLSRSPGMAHAEIPTPVSGRPPVELPNTAALDQSISQLEDQISRLRRYGDELLGLSLHDSHKMLSEQLISLESNLKEKKREKSSLLIENLQREFPGIADMARKEVEKLGYQ